MKNNFKTENLTGKIGHYLAVESGKNEEVILFGLKLFTSLILGYALLILISVKLGVFYEAITAGLTVSIFRAFSGGAHATSQLRCSIIGLLILIPMSFFVKYYYFPVSMFLSYLLSVITIIGILIIYIYAPADTPSKPITSQTQKKYLRRISFILLFVWSIISFLLVFYVERPEVNRLIVSSCFGMIWQIISITPAGYRFVHILDNSLKIIMERRKDCEKNHC